MLNNDPEHSYAGPAFQHDIFVSYSHGVPPDSGGDSDLKTWTHKLIGKLKENVGLSLEDKSRQIKVWYDDLLPGNLGLSEQLKLEVENSATLLIVMSDYYLNSEWCEKERLWFEEEIKRRGGGIENVFVVRALDTENEDWPDYLKDGYKQTVIGFPFCNTAEGNMTRPFGWVVPRQSDTYKEFTRALTNLASAIATRLDDIRGSQRARNPPEPEPVIVNPQVARGPVFLAPGTEDVELLCTELRGHLVQRGCEVYPREEVRIRDLAESDRDHALNAAEAFVQIIGTVAAKEGGAERGKVQLLHEIAAQKPFERFIWRDQRLPLDYLRDLTYRQFVEELGVIPERTLETLAADVAHHLANQGAPPGDDSLLAYMEVPADALHEFHRWKDDISNQDCTVLPLSPPKQGKIRQMQKERESRQLVYTDCKTVLLMYCIDDQLHWLKDAIVNYEKVVAPVRRENAQVPVPVVVDYVGEAVALAGQMGVDVVTRKEGADAGGFWDRLRDIVI